MCLSTPRDRLSCASRGKVMRIESCTMQRPTRTVSVESDSRQCQREVRWTPTRRSHFWSLGSVSQRRVIVPRTGLCRGRHPRSADSAAAYAIEANQSKQASESAAPGFGRQKRPPNLNMGRELRREIRAKVRSLISSPEASIFN
jgi:hypothetical protein